MKANSKKKRTKQKMKTSKQRSSGGAVAKAKNLAYSAYLATVELMGTQHLAPPKSALDAIGKGDRVIVYAVRHVDGKWQYMPSTVEVVRIASTKPLMMVGKFVPRKMCPDRRELVVFGPSHVMSLPIETSRQNLIDGEASKRAYPATFQMPSKKARAAVKVGDHVKVGWQSPHCGGERIWVEVTSVAKNGKANEYQGRLINTPVLLAAKSGSSVEFGPENILELSDES